MTAIAICVTWGLIKKLFVSSKEDCMDTRRKTVGYLTSFTVQTALYALQKNILTSQFLLYVSCLLSVKMWAFFLPLSPYMGGHG